MSTMFTSESGTGSVPAPCLTTAPWGGRIIAVLFILTVALYLVGVLAL